MAGVITDFIAANHLPIEIFTIDTGRLPEETLKVWQETSDKYQIKIAVYYPNNSALEEFVGENGINSFYQSKKLRLNCCEIRKIEPLKRALNNKELWISGLRKEHSASRFEKDFFEYDQNLNLTKFYPILDLKEAELWEYIEKNQVPFNELYKKGYKSIGCAPCSRAILEGEDARAGRWWWEEDQTKECGLHNINGKLVRIKNVGSK